MELQGGYTCVGVGRRGRWGREEDGEKRVGRREDDGERRMGRGEWGEEYGERRGGEEDGERRRGRGEW